MAMRNVLIGGVIVAAGGAIVALGLMERVPPLGPGSDDEGTAASTIAAASAPSPPLPPDLDAAEPELVMIIRQAHQAVVEQPLDHQRWITLGLVYWANSRYALARDCHAVATTLRPSSARAHYHLAMATSACNELDASIELMQRAIDLDDGYSPAHWRLGEWLLDAGRYPEAEASFRRSMAIEPRDPAGPVGLAGPCFARGACTRLWSCSRTSPAGRRSTVSTFTICSARPTDAWAISSSPSAT